MTAEQALSVRSLKRDCTSVMLNCVEVIRRPDIVTGPGPECCRRRPTMAGMPVPGLGLLEFGGQGETSL